MMHSLIPRMKTKITQTAQMMPKMMKTVMATPPATAAAKKAKKTAKKVPKILKKMMEKRKKKALKKAKKLQKKSLKKLKKTAKKTTDGVKKSMKTNIPAFRGSQWNEKIPTTWRTRIQTRMTREKKAMMTAAAVAAPVMILSSRKMKARAQEKALKECQEKPQTKENRTTNEDRTAI